MSEFCPSMWPEEPVPEEEQNCQDCGLYQQGTRMIWGEGNSNGSILILLDNPGARETRDGDSFVCGTRQTLQKAAHEAGFTEQDLYMTYILKRKPVKAYEKEKTRVICMQHLTLQLKQKQPKIIFCLGNVAVQSFFQDEDMDVKSSRGRTYEKYGYQIRTAYHPLAIRRRPNLWKLFLEDWKQLAEICDP